MEAHFNWDLNNGSGSWRGKDSFWRDPESWEHGGFWAKQEGTENREQGVEGGQEQGWVGG